MGAVVVLHPAVRALDTILDELAELGIEATRDPGALYPQPTGVLVGLPAMIRRGLNSHTFELTVLVVSGDPLNSEQAVDRLYSLADQVALGLNADSYRSSSWRSGVNAEPLPAVELTVIVSVTTETEVP